MACTYPEMRKGISPRSVGSEAEGSFYHIWRKARQRIMLRVHRTILTIRRSTRSKTSLQPRNMPEKEISVLPGTGIWQKATFMLYAVGVLETFAASTY